MTPLGPMKKKESLKSSSSLLLPKKLVDDFTHFSSAPKSCITKVFLGSVQQKIEENEEDWQSPKGSALERQCV